MENELLAGAVIPQEAYKQPCIFLLCICSGDLIQSVNQVITILFQFYSSSTLQDRTRQSRRVRGGIPMSIKLNYIKTAHSLE